MKLNTNQKYAVRSLANRAAEIIRDNRIRHSDFREGVALGFIHAARLMAVLLVTATTTARLRAATTKKETQHT